MEGTSATPGRIAYQGEPGAFSQSACVAAYPGMDPQACATFEETLASVRSGFADLAMVPIDNSLHGRIGDVHRLLPDSGLYIVNEVFLPIRMQLLGLPGTTLDAVTDVYSIPPALGQCRDFILAHGLTAHPASDTAGAARRIKERANPACAAIGSRLAGTIYGLDVLAENIEDADHNTTRFLVMSRSGAATEPGTEHTMTSFVFQVRNVPAALYKALGGFATNGVNLTKLESYMVDGSFTATQFYADVEGHPEDVSLKLALGELRFFTTGIRILGIYPMADFRTRRRIG